MKYHYFVAYVGQSAPGQSIHGNSMVTRNAPIVGDNFSDFQEWFHAQNPTVPKLCITAINLTHTENDQEENPS